MASLDAVTIGEPHDALTRAANRMLEAGDGGDGRRLIAVVSEGSRGGIGYRGYDDGAVVVAHLIEQAEMVCKSLGARLVWTIERTESSN